MNTKRETSPKDAVQAYVTGLAEIDAMVANGLPKEAADYAHNLLLAVFYRSSDEVRRFVNAKMWELTQGNA